MDDKTAKKKPKKNYKTARSQQHNYISLENSDTAECILRHRIILSRLCYYNSVTTRETTKNICSSFLPQNPQAIFALPSRDQTAFKHVLRTSDHHRPRCSYRPYLRSGRSTWFLSWYRLALFPSEIMAAWGLRAKRWQDNLLSRLSCVHGPHHPSSTTPPEQLPLDACSLWPLWMARGKMSCDWRLIRLCCKECPDGVTGAGIKWWQNQDLALFAFPHLHQHWPGRTLARAHSLGHSCLAAARPHWCERRDATRNPALAHS